MMGKDRPLTPNDDLIEKLNSLDWQWVNRSEMGIEMAKSEQLFKDDLLLSFLLVGRTFDLDSYTYKITQKWVERVGPKVKQPSRESKNWRFEQLVSN